ncbi:uncharacterized protein LOC114526940 [Dendronephthya gigantea]|uniref:uncharacterized protein LOC114526940 n=1 Tax=Dendronephthya gigantea TaxID=151771 RepID=UPI00106D5A4C|nr:uncharacterized protein LOC114526940 [Dendronephthya gigantea]
MISHLEDTRFILTMESRINIAVFGLGRIGKVHFKDLYNSSRVKIKYVVEELHREAEKYVADYQVDTKVAHTSDMQSVLSDETLHACVISTPNHTHASLVLASIAAGKAVFCEKPLADTVEEIEKCYDEAKKKGVPLICGFNRRFDPGLREIYTRTRAGDVGQVQMVKITSRDSPMSPIDYFKSTKGIYHDCAIHDIDLLTWIYGERPLSVYTAAHSFIKEIGELNDVDTVAIVLKFPSGGIGIIDLSRFACFGHDQRVEVFGNKGMLVQNNYKATNVEFSGKEGSSTGRILNSFMERFAKSYKNVIEHFLDVIQGKCATDITKESILLVSEIVEACEKSRASAQAVRLPQE